MSELKNLIVIDITDNENTVLEPIEIGSYEIKIKEIKSDGVILVKNNSQKSRLWNLICDLKEVINTTLPKELNIGAINPGQNFKQDYDNQNIKEPCLKVEEVCDSEREISDKINNTFLYENTNKISIKINLTNILDLPFTEITLKKDLPEILQQPDIKTPNFGNAELGEEEGKRVLIWKIQSLAANETATLEIQCTVVPKERKDVSLGEINIKYLIDNKKLTLIEPNIRGLTDSMSGVTREEGSSPATWDCNVEFLNESEFNVRLEEVKVTHKIPTGIENVVSETPNLELVPDQSWDKDFGIESQNVPELSSEIVFTPLFGVVSRVIGQIVKIPTIYQVLSAEVNKTINPPEVAAYANTDMTIVNTIPNYGTSCFNRLEIVDEIPPDFVPPLEKDIKIDLKNQEGTIPIQGREEFIELFEINPPNQNPDVSHTITIKFKELKKQVTSGSEITVTYPLLAKNPKPDVTYNTPIEIKANVPIVGKDFIIRPSEEPELKVKYIARKLKTLKSVKPGLEEGQFDISIRIQNKGDVELENIFVRDTIPAGFELTEFTPPEGTTHQMASKGAESDLEVKITELKAGASININYTASGSGDYARTEPHIAVMGRQAVAISEKSSEPSGTSSDLDKVAKPSELSGQKSAEVHNIFSEIFNQIDQGLTADRLGDLMDDKKDGLPSGPIRHQLVKYIKDLKDQGNKAVVGAFKEEVMARLTEFKNKYT